MGNTLFLVIASIPFALVFFIVWMYWRQEQKEKLKTESQRKTDKAIAYIKQTRGTGVTCIFVGIATLFKNSLPSTVVGLLFIVVGIYLAWSVHDKEKALEVKVEK